MIPALTSIKVSLAQAEGEVGDEIIRAAPRVIDPDDTRPNDKDPKV